LPVSLCTISGVLRVTVCTGGVSAGSVCEEGGTASSKIDLKGQRDGAAAPLNRRAEVT
jgi:hypothetical protein